MVDRFIARENIKHYRRELENGVAEPTRATMLRLLVEEENHLGHTREQLAKLDHHISRLSEIMARHVELMDNLQSIGQPSERASMVLGTYNDLMAVYIAYRQTITATLADGKAREG
jgi:rubrerythrin